MIGAPNFLMGHMTRPRPYEGRFVVRRLTCTFNIYIKFESLGYHVLFAWSYV